MAQPDRTPAELALTIHNNDPGYKQGPFTLDSKTILRTDGDKLLMEVVVSRQTNVWTAIYSTQADGTLGKVYRVEDQDGVPWYPRGGYTTWGAS